YTAIISKIFNKAPSILPVKKGEKLPKIRLINKKTIFEGLFLELRDKTLHKTKQKVYFKAPPTIHKKIGVGDIVIFSVKGKKYHLLIIQVYKPTELDKGVSFIQPKFKSFFLKKSTKGFQKNKYVTKP